MPTAWTPPPSPAGPCTLDGGAGATPSSAPAPRPPGTASSGLDYNVFIGGDGNDTLTGGIGVDRIREHGDVDFLLSADQLTGRGTDRFTGMELAWLIGGAGANRLDVTGFTGSHTVLDGQAGNDTLSGGVARDWVRAVGNVDFTLSDQQLTGLGTDTLVRMDSAWLTGGAAANRIDASAFTGDLVVLEGRAGADTLRGRTAGRDRVREYGDTDFTLTDTRLTGNGTDTLSGIDEAHLIGGAGGNTLDVAAFTGILTLLEGGGGDDTLIGRTTGLDRVRARGDAGFTLTDTQLIGQGTDTLTAIDQAELIGDGNADRLDAAAFTRGRVWLYGESGDDTLLGGSGADDLSGGAGDDAITGGDGIDRVVGQGDTDFTLSGGGSDPGQLTGLGTDTLNGIEEGYLCGGPGANSLNAAAFTGSLVILEGQGGDDVLIGRAVGRDQVRAVGDADFTLTDTRLTGLGTDTLTEIDAADLRGYSGDNRFTASGFTRGPVDIDGGGGRDTLLGGTGADRLRGGSGADTLTGGAGADRFRFVTAAEGADTITDFTSGTDHIAGGQRQLRRPTGRPAGGGAFPGRWQWANHRGRRIHVRPRQRCADLRSRWQWGRRRQLLIATLDRPESSGGEGYSGESRPERHCQPFWMITVCLEACGSAGSAASADGPCSRRWPARCWRRGRGRPWAAGRSAAKSSPAKRSGGASGCG